jgi:hypothetical protein
MALNRFLAIDAITEPLSANGPDLVRRGDPERLRVPK